MQRRSLERARSATLFLIADALAKAIQETSGGQSVRSRVVGFEVGPNHPHDAPTAARGVRDGLGVAAEKIRSRTPAELLAYQRTDDRNPLTNPTSETRRQQSFIDESETDALASVKRNASASASSSSVAVDPAAGPAQASSPTSPADEEAPELTEVAADESDVDVMDLFPGPAAEPEELRAPPEAKRKDVRAESVEATEIDQNADDSPSLKSTKRATTSGEGIELLDHAAKSVLQSLNALVSSNAGWRLQSRRIGRRRFQGKRMETRISGAWIARLRSSEDCASLAGPNGESG
jgi:hypothetical protein